MQWADRIGRRIKLRDLHVLHAVAQAGSMTKAAGDLAISVPVVSKAIAELEHTIGVPLLDRSPKGVEPTAYGRALLRRGLVAFDELRQGVRDIEFLADPTWRVQCKHRSARGKLRCRYHRPPLQAICASFSSDGRGHGAFAPRTGRTLTS